MRERRNMSQPWGNINMFNDNNKKQSAKHFETLRMYHFYWSLSFSFSYSVLFFRIPRKSKDEQETDAFEFQIFVLFILWSYFAVWFFVSFIQEKYTWNDDALICTNITNA